VRQAPDNYFVRLDAGHVPPPAAPPGARSRRAARARPVAEERPPRSRRRRRRRTSGGTRLLVVVLAALATWAVWASRQPGGIEGTINGFVDDVRGEVQDASVGRNLKHAAEVFNDAYDRSGVYPTMTDDQLTTAGVGIDVHILHCGAQAVVLQTITQSRLLVAGKDLGEVTGRVPCPADLADPAPWKLK
jgi:hypothetical protein